MALPDQAIVEFTSQDDIHMLAEYFYTVGWDSTADRLFKRKYYQGLCARIAGGNFASFGLHNTYEDAYWSGFVTSTDLQFMYCSVQHLLTYAGFLICEEDEGEYPDLDGLL